jgi:hypothetical protein
MVKIAESVCPWNLIPSKKSKKPQNSLAYFVLPYET